MYKRLIIALLCLYVITGVFATQARMSGLGNPYGLIKDDTDVYTYPATIFNYSGVAVGELNRSAVSTQWTMSANIPIFEYKLGVYLNQDTEINENFLNYQYPEETIYDMDITKSVEFNFGFMDKFAVGFGTSSDYTSDFTYSLNDGSTLKIDPVANFNSVFGGYSANDLDIGLRFEMANVTDVEGESYGINVEELNYFEMDYTSVVVNGRKIFRPDDNIELAVKAGFAMENRELDLKNLANFEKSKEEYTSSMLDLGFSMQYKANNKNNLIFGVTPIIYNPIKTESTEYNDSDSYKSTVEVNALFFPEYNLAVESQICSWLTGRMGANQSYVHVTEKMNNNSDTTVDTEDTYYEKNYNMNLGLTFSFGNFCVDSVLEQELLFDGPNFLGGKSNGLASEISVKYKF